MKPYSNRGGDSGIVAYEYNATSIRVRFSDHAVYEYTAASAGQSKIDKMKRLADAGEGLNSFINRNVKFQYSRKIR
jgi:hypothetical protein